MAVKERRISLKSTTIKQLTDHGTMYVTITYKVARKPFEVFVTMGKAGSHERAWIEALSTCISVALRSGVPAPTFIDQLRGISCGPIPDGSGQFIKSPADGLGLVLQEFCFPGSTERHIEPEPEEEPEEEEAQPID